MATKDSEYINDHGVKGQCNVYLKFKESGVTLIFSYIRRLGPFSLCQNFEFQ